MRQAKIFLPLLGLFFAMGFSQAFADSSQQALGIAQSTRCVRDAINELRDTHFYKEDSTVEDNGDGTATVTFAFTPRCYFRNPPCLAPSRAVISTVNFQDKTATCP